MVMSEDGDREADDHPPPTAVAEPGLSVAPGPGAAAFPPSGPDCRVRPWAESAPGEGAFGGPRP